MKSSGNPSSHWQMVPKGPDAAAHPHPDNDTIQQTMKSTMEALSGIVTKKQAANNPKALSADARPGGPQYIKYTPKTTTQAHNSGVDHRIIQMQEMPKDPLEPPKFRHQKHYRVMKEEVVPLMHSPPKKLTKEEQQRFTIPPCVSAWKNAKVRSRLVIAAVARPYMLAAAACPRGPRCRDTPFRWTSGWQQMGEACKRSR